MMIIVFLFVIILCVIFLVLLYVFNFFWYVLKSLELDGKYKTEILNIIKDSQELMNLTQKRKKSII